MFLRQCKTTFLKFPKSRIIKTPIRTFSQPWSYPINHSKSSLNHFCPSGLYFRKFSTVLNKNGLKALEVSNSARACTPEEAGEFRVVKIPGKTFGAEVFGIRGLEHAQELGKELHALIVKHKFLVYRKLSLRLTPSDHVEFAKLFGSVTEELSKPPDYLKKGIHLSALTQDGDEQASNLADAVLDAHKQSPYPPAIFRVVRNPEDDIAFGEGWHTDLSFRKDPPKFSLLAARVLPPTSGDTLFMDMEAIYDDLSEDLKKKIIGQKALHTDRTGNFSHHPCVRVHPDTGIKVLFVNCHFTDWQGDELLTHFIDRIDEISETDAPCCIRHQWHDGDIIMWDEISTQHNADGMSYTGYYRECHRVLVHGAEPVLGY